MPSSSFELNTLHLIHNLKSDNPSTGELLDLLGKSDIDFSEMNIMRNESESSVGKNLQREASLMSEASGMQIPGEKKYKVFRRETPFISSRIPSSSPTWARGAKPAYTLGPFLALDGRNFWFDFYFYEKLIPVYVSGDAAPVMLLPLKLFIFQANKKKYNVGDGSIWMRADKFASGLNNTHYTGLKITGGMLELSEEHNIINDTITINSFESFNLKLNLNNSFVNTCTGKEGIDARNAVIKLPESVELKFATGKFSVKALSLSSWELYGDERNFTWQQNGAVVFNTFLNRLVIPLDTDKARFEIVNCSSDFFNISEKAKVISCGWCLNVAQMNTSQPFAVGGNGALAILCGNGLQNKWKGLAELPGIIKMNAPLIMSEPGKFSVSDAFPLFKQHTEIYSLWKRDISGEIRTSTELLLKKNKPFIYYCDQAGYESIAASVDANFETDKPYKADGSSVSPKTIDSLYIKYVTPTLHNMFVYDLDMLLQANPSFNHLKKPEIYQFAITNAYMITTPPSSLLLTGSYDDENIIVNGMLNIAYGLFILTPILPHPYTANLQLTEFGVNAERLREIQEITQWYPLLTNYIMSTCVWDDANIVDGNSVNVDFELLTDLFRSLTNLPTGPEVTNQALAQLTQQDILEELSLIHNGFTNNDTYGRNLFSLLDLSTHYDLFGVNMIWSGRRYEGIRYGSATTISTGVVTIEKMNLQTPMSLLNAFTLPHISWEPVNNKAKTSEPNYPPEGILSFRDNGPPTIFSQLDNNPVVIDPLKHLERFRENIINKDKFSYIIFSLPHGKVSLALLHHFSDEYASVRGNYNFIRPAFKFSGNNVKGGIQFRVSANKENNRPMLEGMTNQLSNLVHKNFNIPESILGGIVHQIFQNDFYLKKGTSDSEIKADGVPVTHIDFSGYGASTYSNWRNPEARIAQVSQTLFNILVGRVSHEIVQVVSILCPWGIKVVRTITLYRNNNAVIYREDSGWVAQSNGLFDFYFKLESGEIKNPFSFHPGLVKGLFNVHNIKEIDEPHIEFKYNVGPDDYYFDSATKTVMKGPSATLEPAEFAAVTFDADVVIENISSGESNGKVSGKSFKGYLQILPQAVPINASAMKEIFNRQQNSIGGSVDCTMKIGGSEQLMKVNRIDVSASFQNGNINDHIFVVSAKGSIQLPSEGSWSIVEVDKGSGEVAPVANKSSVPVIRKGERDRSSKDFKVNGNDKISRIAFADSLMGNNNFTKRFGYVQNTGSQKLLLNDPSIDQNAPAQLLSEAPLLADTYRLLNSKGPFPNLNNVISIESVTKAITNIIPEGLQKIVNFNLPGDLSFDIIGKDKEPLHMYVKYKTSSPVSYFTDSKGASPSDKWKSELENISVAVDVGPFKELLTIKGDMKAKSSFDTGFEKPELVLCDDLKPIYDILEFLANLDPTNPVEALKKALKVYMSNSADSWEYKFKAEKEIPVVKFPFDPVNYNSPTTPLKLDAYFKIGCYFNQPIKIPNAIDELMPSAGAYLELGADLRVMCFSLAAATVYATGRAQVGLAADIKSGPSLYFKFGFGIELCVGLPVIGSVSVMYLVGVDMKLTTKELVVGAFLYFRGRAEILGGIVTITIQIEAAGKIQKQLNGGPTSCIAACTFALDISIFLIINISFTETWEESRQIA